MNVTISSAFSEIEIVEVFTAIWACTDWSCCACDAVTNNLCKRLILLSYVRVKTLWVTWAVEECTRLAALLVKVENEVRKPLEIVTYAYLTLWVLTHQEVTIEVLPIVVTTISRPRAAHTVQEVIIQG